MKKFFIFGCALLMGVSFSLAQTTTISNNTAPARVTASNTLENIEIRIDRRLMNFNRYIAARDMAGVKNLVSNENKDFYANFLKYLEESPVFTVKRDTTQNIAKTPLDEYVFGAVMSLGGKDAKVSMKFIEEDSETGNKWVILDSDLHIVGKGLSLASVSTKPVTPPTKGSLTSNALNKDIPVNTSPDQKPKDPTNIPTLPSDTGAVVAPPPVGSAPIASAAIPPKPATVKTPTPISPIASTKAGLGIGGIIGIAVGIILLLGILGSAYYFIRKRRGIKKTLLAAQALSVASAATVVSAPAEALPLATSTTSETPSEPTAPSLSPETPISSPSALEQMESNVSLVEEVPSGPDSQIDNVSSAQSAPTEELPIQETSSSEMPSVPQDDIQESSIPQQDILPEQEPSSDTANTPVINAPATVEENISITPLADISILSNTSPEEASLTPPIPTMSLDDIVGTTANDLPVSSEQPPIMDPIFSSTTQTTIEAQPDPLFENILSPKPDPSTASSLFGGMA